jgi:hypothetical protein
MRRRGPPSTEVPEEYGPSCIRERQNQRGPVFARRHVDKEEHGVVAEARGVPRSMDCNSLWTVGHGRLRGRCSCR